MWLEKNILNLNGKIIPFVKAIILITQHFFETESTYSKGDKQKAVRNTVDVPKESNGGHCKSFKAVYSC